MSQATPVSESLVELTRLRWNLAVIAQLRPGPMGFSALAAALDLSRDTLSRSLGALQPRWLGRSAVRAPYRLTRAGVRIAPTCEAILRRAQDHQGGEFLFRRWSLPVVAALRGWSLHFGELRAMLPDVTPRALATALKEMQAAGLIERRIEPHFPPVAVYRLSAEGGILVPWVGRL